MGVFFSVIKDFNRLEKIGISKEYIDLLNIVVNFMKMATGLIHEHPQKILDGLNLARKNLSGTVSDNVAEVEKLLLERTEARASKNWVRSDEIRNRLNEMGIIVKDNPDGTVGWSYK
jgi:cysteinyl-tRNA synthetase